MGVMGVGPAPCRRSPQREGGLGCARDRAGMGCELEDLRRPQERRAESTEPGGKAKPEVNKGARRSGLEEGN